MKSILLTSLLISLTGAITDLEMKQLTGIKNLLQKQQNNVFATCSIVFFADLTPFDTANEKCKKFDVGAGSSEGNLVTVNTEEKNADLKMLLEMAYPKAKQPESDWANTKWVWAGLRKTKNVVKAAKSKSKEYRAEDWQWADGSPPGDFANWLPRQPDQSNMPNGKKECKESPKCYQNQMRINHDGEWDDTYKFKTHPYACDYRGKYIVSAEKKTWADAKAACADAGLQLAKIRSDDELKEMMSAITYFLGPKDESWDKWDANNWVWLGGNDINDEKKWVWVDGDEIKWRIPWEKKAGNDNSRRLMTQGQDVMALSRWSTIDDSFETQIFRPFACQCPGT